jgi:hypothetical protein
MRDPSIRNLSIDVWLDTIHGTGDELRQEVPDHKEGCDVEALFNVLRAIRNEGLEVSKEEDDQNGSEEEFIILLLVKQGYTAKQISRKEVEGKDGGKENSKEGDSQHSVI